MFWERVRQENQQVALGDSSSGPGKISAHTCNAIRGGRFIYVFGGFDRDDRLTNQVHVFDAETQLWTQPVINGLPPCPRDSHSCTTVQDNLFVFGGTNATNYFKDLHILDTSSHTWRCPDVRGEGPEAREAHSAALVDKRLFIFGGVGGTSVSDDDDVDKVLYNDLYILNTETFVWERAITSGNPPSERGSHTCTTWKNKIVVVGGQDLYDYFLSDVYILDTDTFVWIELNTSGQLLTPRAGHVTVAHESNLFVFGGYTYSQNLYNDLYVLDLETGQWSKIFVKDEGPSARFSAAAACLDAGLFFFLGGCNNKLVSLDDVYYLHLEGGYISCANQNQGRSSLRKQMKLKCSEPRLTRTNIQYCQHPDPNIMDIFEDSTNDWLCYDSIIAVLAVVEDLRRSTAPAEDEFNGIEGLYVYDNHLRLDPVYWEIEENKLIEGFDGLQIKFLEAKSSHHAYTEESMQRLHRRIYASPANRRLYLAHYRWIDIVVGVDSGDGEEEEDVEDEDGGDDDEDGGDEDELWEEHIEDGHEYRPVDIAVRQACLAMDLHGDPHYGPSPAAATCSVTGTTGYIAPGLEKAEKEVVVLKQQLDASVSKVSALEDRNNHLDSALKECVRQLWQGREEQNQKNEEAITKKCVGKSKLLTMFTGTHSEAASYEFTTLTCIPGIIHYNDTKIQLLDLPRIIKGVSEGRGRGRQVIVVAKSSDLVLMVLDASKSEGHRQILTKELEAVGLRLNKRPPQIYIKKKKTGGISFNTTTPLTRIDEKLCYQILHEYKIHNAEVLFREDARVDDFMDVIEGNRKYIKCVYVYNKIDVVGIADVDRLARQPNSMLQSKDRLLAQMWDEMGLVRVYTKPQGQQPDFDEPFVLSADRGDCTVEDFCIDKMFTPHHN